MGLEPIIVRAFDLLTGQPIMRLPAVSFSYATAVNSPGSGSVKMLIPEASAGRGLRERLMPWHTTVAFMRGARVLFAGPVTARSVDRESQSVTLHLGGCWDLLEKRLVLNHALAAKWKNGEVLIDEDSPAPEWQLALKGSFRDIARGLIAESQKWGPLPIDLPATEGGVQVRNYDGFDFATVAERLKQLGGVQGGPEIRFDPYLKNGNLRFELRAEDELIDHIWRWNEAIPGQRVTLEAVDEDGDLMATECYALGGRKEDLVLVARSSTDRLTAAGWPLMQVADTTHSTVSELGTLLGHAADTVTRGMVTQESFKLRVGAEYEVRPGDWAQLRIDDAYFGREMLPLKILSVSASDGEWLSVEARLRVEEAKWRATTPQLPVL